MFVDSHCHLTFEPMYSNIPGVLENCKKENIETILTIGTNYENSLKSIQIANSYDNVFCSIGIHPNEAESLKKNIFSDLKNLINKSKKIIGIGETGLDFYYEKSCKNIQVKFFNNHIELAKLLDLPVIVHTRNAEVETLNIIKHNYKNANFLIHCFTGSRDFCENLLSLGCYISFSGILTFKKSHELREIAKIVPLDKLLIETDSPYLSPEPIRSKTNFPHNVKLVAEQVSIIKDISIETVAKYTTTNFNKVFKIKYV